MQELAKGLSIKVEQHVKNVRNLDTGEAQIGFSEQHSNNGAPLQVPTAFVIAVQLFDKGPFYSIIVRLRYRLRDGSIQWSFTLVNGDDAMDNAVSDMIDKLRTALPTALVVEGTP